MRTFPFMLRPPRHRLARVLFGAAGLALLGLFTVFGLVIAAVALAGFALHRLYLQLRGARPRPHPLDPHVIEGEFSVVEKPRLPH